MGNYKNLSQDEAIAKIKELAEDIKICMFFTQLSVRPIPTRPMSVQEVDDKGNLWFISSAKSNKNFEIKHDEDVQLVFSKNADAHFLSIFGKAVIYKDKAHIDEVWTPIAKTLFEEEKNEPDVTVIKIASAEDYYWDTKEGKMITMLRWAAGAVVGKAIDDGSREGRLEV